MANTSDHGHNHNVVNFERLIISCVSYGRSYNPSKASLKVDAMQAKLSEAKRCLDAVNEINSVYKNAVVERVAEFNLLDKLITRVNNALKASDVPKDKIDLMQSLVFMLKGRRVTPKRAEEEKSVAEGGVDKVTEVSTSHMSYDSRLENFDKFLTLLSTVDNYTPNEVDLRVEFLKGLLSNLRAKNLAVFNAESTLDSARISRNDVLYRDGEGVVDLVQDVKMYVKSVYGATSPRYRQVSGMTFTKHSV